MGSKAILVAVVIAAVILGGFVWYTAHAPTERQKITLTPEAKAYVRNLHLDGVTLKATDSYAQQTITEIEGQIKNAGDRPVRLVELNCVFYDSYGQVVRRELVPIVKKTLNSNEVRAFRLPFDDIPDGWNHQMPQLVIARIIFG